MTTYHYHHHHARDRSLRGPREPKPVDVAMLQRFHARLVQSSNGTLRWLLLIYLRTYESLRQMLDQRARRKAQQRAIDAKQRGVKEGEQYDFEYDEDGNYKGDDANANANFAGSLEATQHFVAEGVTLQRRHSPFDVAELPGRNILEKRMAGVLQDMRMVWTRQRRGEGLFSGESPADSTFGGAMGATGNMDGRSTFGGSPVGAEPSVLKQDDPRTFTYIAGDKEGYHLSCRHTRVRKGCAHCTRVARQDRRKRFELGFVDGGAGPKEFWQNVNYPKQQQYASPGGRGYAAGREPTRSFEVAYEVRGPDGKKRVSFEKMEAHLWRLSLLVRCQDRAQDLRLFRDEPQRKLLDSRFYEVNGDYCNNQSINQSIT